MEGPGRALLWGPGAPASTVALPQLAASLDPSSSSLDETYPLECFSDLPWDDNAWLPWPAGEDSRETEGL